MPAKKGESKKICFSDGIKELTEKFRIECVFVETNSYNEVFKLLEEKKVDAGVVNKNFGNKKEKEFKVNKELP